MTEGLVYFISRKYTNEDFGGSPSLDEKIDIFEDRIRGWQLDVAKEIWGKLGTTRDAFETYQFALLAILFSYFEMIGQYLDGAISTNRSREIFVRGLRSAFPRFSEDEGGLIYKRIRCGMYHAGIVQHGALLSDRFSDPIRIEQAPNIVYVNPVTLIDTLDDHFSAYIALIKRPESLTERRFFLMVFDQTRKVPI